jgi:23S rRNA (uracil1939-C5)-methyltransferase
VSAPKAAGPTQGDSPGVAPRPQRGEELQLRIEALAYGGEGIARLGDGGYVVFVAGAVPGDLVRAVIHKRKRTYAHARTLEVLEPSPERIPPRADHPGVPWQVLPYERQLEVKQAQIDEALRRIGRLEGFALDAPLAAEERWRYRNKLEYSFGTLAGAGRQELICGFHAPAGANHVVPVSDCLLASERGNAAREAALSWCRGQGLSAWERGWPRQEQAGQTGEGSSADSPPSPPSAQPAPAPDGRARLRNLVVREGRRSGRLQVRIVTTEGELDAGSLAVALHEALGESLCGVLWTRSSRPAETTAGGDTELVWGEAELPEQICDLDLRISPEAFFQTNTEMAERLYGVVGQLAALEGWERVYDLYCGIGPIALSLAPRAGEVWGVEAVAEAVADAAAGAKRNEITNARFAGGDVRLVLKDLLARGARPDVLVVDPPRAGLSKTVVHRVIEAAPRRVVYVSCNPTTLAPNAAELAQAGWALRSVVPVDMFPQTHHIECVALLERARRRPGGDAASRPDGTGDPASRPDGTGGPASRPDGTGGDGADGDGPG